MEAMGTMHGKHPQAEKPAARASCAWAGGEVQLKVWTVLGLQPGGPFRK